MNTTILIENEKKRIDYPLSRLICFVMFTIWQMGFIFYMGPALTVDGKIPLPVDMDNTTTLIAVCYILNILWLTFIPGKYVYAARAGVVIALISDIGLFLPLSSDMLVLLLFSIHTPALSLPACGLIGIGLISCALLPLFGVVLIKQYPSKYIPAIIMSFAVVAVLISSSMLEAFRDDINMLYMSYIAIVVIMAIIYLHLAPYMLRALNEKISNLTKVPEEVPQHLTSLTERELEVADLISRGYSNRDIAKMLFISEHTVKDHTKNIYRKLEIHSRFELLALINRK